MGFHYGKEKTKFDREWERLSCEYRSAGMSEQQIETMKKYDWNWFRSQRIFQMHTQPLPSEYLEDEQGGTRVYQKFKELSCYWEASTDFSYYGWLFQIENEQLFEALCELPVRDLELIRVWVRSVRNSQNVRLFQKCHL